MKQLLDKNSTYCNLTPSTAQSSEAVVTLDSFTALVTFARTVPFRPMMIHTLKLKKIIINYYYGSCFGLTTSFDYKENKKYSTRSI